MINFEKVYNLNIPEGSVEKIHDQNNILLWQRPHIYGVSWSGGTSPTMTRTDEAANFATPTIGTGTTKGSSPFDKCYPWSDITTETINSSVLVKIPKFYYKWTSSGSTLKLQICNKKIDGFFISPMHADRDDGKGERDYAYIGKYKCVYDYRSRAGYRPLNSKTITAMRTGIKNLGTGFYQHDYASFWTLRMLFLVEWATWDSQTVLQNTSNYDSIANIRTGGTSSMTYHTGISANGYNIQYRYVEDPWENTLEWIDGIYFSGTNVYVINNPNNFTVGSNGTKIGTRSTGYGYIKSWTIPTVSGYQWALIPKETVTAESYVKDSYYYASGGTVAYIGGARNAWGNHGAFFFYTDFTASGTSTSISSRLMYLP